MSSTVIKGSGWNFSLEDTTDKCYRDISNELSTHGWNRVSYKKRSKLERKRLELYICAGFTSLNE